MLNWSQFFKIDRRTVFERFYQLPGWSFRRSSGQWRQNPTFVLPVHRLTPRCNHFETKEEVDARRAALERYEF